MKTNKLALLVHELSGIAMVHADTQVYTETFLCAFSLFWNVESVLTLNETIAAAAFGMFTNHTKAVDAPMAGINSNGDANDKDDDDEVMKFQFLYHRGFWRHGTVQENRIVTGWI